MMLMVGYAHAAGPDWDKTSLTTLLEYHERVMKKAHEGERAQEKMKRLIEADYEMRTKWTLGYSTEEHPTLTAAIQHHRSESAYLFQDINKKTSTYGHYSQHEDNEKGRASSAKGAQNQKRNRSRGRSISPRKRAVTADEPFTLQQTTPNGAEICVFYNKASGCKDPKCKREHTCNYPGCNKVHPRCANHPTRPSKRGD